MRVILIAIGAAILGASMSSLGATTHLVLPDGSGDFPTIQAAVDASVAGDVIELGDGVFRGEGNRDVLLSRQFAIRSASGDPARCIIDCEGGPGNYQHGFLILGGGPSSSLQGLTVTHGYADCEGGAIECYESTRFEDCVFIDNVVEWAYGGGGVYCGGGSPTFVNCRFERNIAVEYMGGGIGIWYVDEARFDHCTFVGNQARGVGGCCVEFTSLAVFTDCVFWDNSADATGGLSCSDESAVVLDRCTFAGNASDALGAIHVGMSSSLTLSNVIVAFNEGTEGVSCLHGGTATLGCCDIFGNAGGDWIGCIAGYQGIEGNISEDPLFCDWQGGDFRLELGSPCAPEHNPACGLIGALPVGCGTTPVLETSWGGIKALFRNRSR